MKSSNQQKLLIVGRGTGKLTYDEKIYNYRQARGRRVIETTFGIFANEWRIFLSEIDAALDMVDRIVVAAVVYIISESTKRKILKILRRQTVLVEQFTHRCSPLWNQYWLVNNA